MRSTGRTNATRAGAILLGAALILGGCAPQYQNHGYIPPADLLEQITVGVDTRATVAATVGVPASAGVLDNSGYYYVRSRRKTVAFFAPQEVEREVLAISFTENGVVQNIERFGLDRGRVVPISRRVTSSPVSNTSFLRQLLGNIGRIGPSGLSG